MRFHATKLPGVRLIEPYRNHDERGFFARTYCDDEFAANGLNTRWPQANLSRSDWRGAVRGLHFQAGGEIKVVRCSRGRIFDVVLDARKDSPTFGHWEAFELDDARQISLYVPAGYAHGFQCLSAVCEVAYLMSERYAPELARGVRWNDPQLNIPWPLKAKAVSARDAQLPLIGAIE